MEKVPGLGVRSARRILRARRVGPLNFEGLKRLGIVSGDNNAFKPKEPINRAEMAVMLNKTYEVLTQGIGSTGEITQVSQKEVIR